MNLSHFYIESQQFAVPIKYSQYCNGRLCASCGKCRDWYYNHNDLETWRWIQGCSNWQQKDVDRWDNGKIWERFAKRDGATCYGHVRGYCLCDDNVRN